MPNEQYHKHTDIKRKFVFGPSSQKRAPSFESTDLLEFHLVKVNEEREGHGSVKSSAGIRVNRRERSLNAQLEYFGIRSADSNHRNQAFLGGRIGVPFRTPALSIPFSESLHALLHSERRARWARAFTRPGRHYRGPTPLSGVHCPGGTPSVS
jgi:hypothetical protein